MNQEIEFIKYKNRGAYHWDQVSSDPLKGNAFVKARYQKCIQLLENEINDLRQKKVLDYGCGDGVLTYMLDKKGACAYGVDISNIPLNLARNIHQLKGCNSKFSKSTNYKTPFEDNFFHAVICSDVIEHVQYPEIILKEIYRILKKNGIAIISTPIRFTEYPLDKMHVVEWFQQEFADLICQIFSEVRFSVSHPLFWFELITRNNLFRIIVNILSLFKNPFISNTHWQYFVMQYAIIKK